MTTIQIQIQAKIESFARELEALVRQAAVAAVADALGTGAPKAVVRRKAAKKAKASKPAAKKAAAPKAQPAAKKPAAKKASKPAKKGGKPRSPAAVADAAAKIFAHVKANAGQRSELVRAATGVAKNIWVPAVQQLIAEKKIVSKGQKRATSFTAR
ncbi:MAG TPA: hypothetical protein VF316_06655 [Polyangiaceae bacterium]